MKILLVIHDFWPNYKAGSENATYYLARELAKRHDVFVFTVEPNSDKHGFHEIYSESGFNVIKIHKRSEVQKEIKDTYLNEDLDMLFRKYLKEIQPHIVHIQHLIGLSLNFIRIAKENDVPVIYTAHDFWLECPSIRKYYKDSNCFKIDIKRCENCTRDKFILRYIIEANKKSSIYRAILDLAGRRYVKRLIIFILDNLKLRKIFYDSKVGYQALKNRKKDFLISFQNIDLIISPSRYLAKNLADYGFDEKKIMVVEHGIPMPDELAVHKKYYAKNSVINFSYISHITQDKGFYLMVEEFRKLEKKYNNIRLNIYGSYNPQDKKVVKTLDLIKKEKNIEYRGVFDNRKINRVLANTDVTIIPSLWQEIYGLVLDESFLFKVPVIVSNMGGLPERVKVEKNGLIFNPNIKGDLSEKMAMIASNPEILNTMVRNITGIKSIDKYAREMENLYEKICSKITE